MLAGATISRARWGAMNGLRFVLMLAICLVVVGCPAREQSVRVPPVEVRGAWETDHPKYEDRYFEIREDILVLGMGEETAASHPIRAIATQTDGMGTLYLITYLDAEGVENVFGFYYYPVGGGLIRFKNQWDIAWNRRSGTP